MSCVFCNSSFHRSEFCENYLSDECRSQFLWDNDICEFCILPEGETDQHDQQICNMLQKCNICFSRSHHSIFCPDRLTAPKLFLPKIVADLMPRFLQNLNTLEIYSMAFTFPKKVLNLVNLKPLNIDFIKQYTYCIPGLKNGTNYILEDEIRLGFHSQTFPLFKAISSKVITIRARLLFVTNFASWSEDFLLLLTRFIKKLVIRNTTFAPKIKFATILKKIPFVETMEINNCGSISIENSWLEDFVAYKNGNRFKRLHLKIPCADFNFKALAQFMEEKCQELDKIHLECPMQSAEFEKIQVKLCEYFVEVTGNFFCQSSILCFDLGLQESLSRQKLKKTFKMKGSCY